MRVHEARHGGRRWIGVGAGVLALSVALLSPIGSAAASAEVEAESGEVEPVVDDGQTIAMIEFDHPVSLTDATTLRRAGADAILGYRLDSESLVGDYWPSTNQSLGDFLESVRTNTGTTPEVVGAYIQIDRDSLENAARSASPAVVGRMQTNLPEHEAAPADPNTDFAHSSRSTHASTQSPAGDQARAFNETWKPNWAEAMIYDRGTSIDLIAKYEWSTLTPFASPLVTEDHWGMEFAFDFWTHMRPTVPGWPMNPMYGFRPQCGGSDYKNWAAASNHFFNWYAMMSWNDMYIDVPDTAGMYGDYNDLSDQCERSTVAVGIADPWELTESSAGTNHLSIAMFPNRGQDATSRVGANVQLVERYTCESSSMPLTDCMGANIGWVYPEDDPISGYDHLRMVLNADTSSPRYAPNLCWYSDNWGTTAAATWDC